MTEKMQTLWKSLDHRIVVNQRELVLGIAACTLAGVVAGILLSPRKTVTIASNNGNNNGNSADLTDSEQPEQASPDGKAEA